MENDLFKYYKESCLNNLCDEYKSMWRACGKDKDKLVRMALMQQSIPHMMHFSYTGLGLSKEYIKDTFKDYINGRRTIQNCEGVKGYTYAIFVDYNGIVGVSMDVIALMYCDDVTLVIPKTKCPTIYCGCKTNMHVIGNGYNCIRIYAFDESKVTLDDVDENSFVTVLKYSEDVELKKNNFCLAMVNDFKKDLRL